MEDLLTVLNNRLGKPKKKSKVVHSGKFKFDFEDDTDSSGESYQSS